MIPRKKSYSKYANREIHENLSTAKICTLKILQTFFALAPFK